MMQKVSVRGLSSAVTEGLDQDVSTRRGPRNHFLNRADDKGERNGGSAGDCAPSCAPNKACKQQALLNALKQARQECNDWRQADT